MKTMFSNMQSEIVKEKIKKAAGELHIMERGM
jgi:hypothetical protein